MKSITKKTLAATAVVGAAAAPTALGQVVVNQSLTPATNYYIDLDDLSPSGFSTNATGYDIRLAYQQGGGGFKSDFQGYVTIYGNDSGGYSNYTLVGNEAFILNETITGSFYYGDGVNTENQNGIGPWALVTGANNYLGFTRGGNAGWINLDYNPNTSGTGNISVVSYDWDSGGGITQAGVSAVPEPAATAAIAALLAGGAAFFQRRRRKVG
jgi:hypothetical protein